MEEAKPIRLMIVDDHLMMDAWEEHLSIEDAVDYYTTNI